MNGFQLTAYQHPCYEAEEHQALPNRLAVALPRRYPMTEEEAKGVDEIRRLRRAGLVAP